jgi:hypothetical protein
MLHSANLSLDQAPPLSIPLRFFLTAPLFGLGAAFLLIIYGPEALLSRWGTATLALTHLLTLGFLALVMCGAILQMLPVIAGSPVPRVHIVGTLVHLLLTLGTTLLVTGFLTGSSFWLGAAAISLTIGFAIFILAVTLALWRVKATNATINGMRMAILSLIVTAGLGVMLIVGRAGWIQLDPLLFADIHLTWGLLGWVALLVVGLAYQVVPMFQVTPEYPAWMKRWLAGTLLFFLILWSALHIAVTQYQLPASVESASLGIIIFGYMLFALATLLLQHRRRRRVSDVTLLFWRTGMGAILLCALLWISGNFAPALKELPQFNLLLGIGLIAGAGLSLLNGMLYKIVPFLTWFHLQNRQLTLMCMTVKIPNMKELLPDKASKLQFSVHLVFLALIILAIFFPAWFTHAAGVMFGLSCLLLWLNLARVTWRYRVVNRILVSSSEKITQV